MVEKKVVELCMHTWVKSADIWEDAILSYELCQLRGVDISTRKHSLLCLKSGQEFWDNGVRVAEADKPDSLVHVVDRDRPELA